MNDALQRMFGHSMHTAQKTLDSFPFPRQHVRRLYELMEEIEARREAKAGFMQAKIDMWEFINQCVPAVKGKDVSVDVSKPMRPALVVTGDKAVPVPGKKKCIGLLPIPQESRHRLLELIEADELSEGPLAKYELWSFIYGLFPELDTPDGRHAIFAGPETLAIVVYKPATPDEDDE